MPRRTRYDKSLKIAKIAKRCDRVALWIGVVYEARSLGMKSGENHLWYRVAMGEDELSILNMEDFNMAKERRVSISEAPEWMLNKIALLKLTSQLDGEMSTSLGGRVGDIFYIRKEDENDGE